MSPRAVLQGVAFLPAAPGLVIAWTARSAADRLRGVRFRAGATFG